MQSSRRWILVSGFLVAGATMLPFLGWLSPGESTSRETANEWKSIASPEKVQPIDNDFDPAADSAQSARPPHPEAKILADPSAQLNAREKAAFELARRPPDEAYRELAHLLNDKSEDPRLRAAAAEALSKIDTDDARKLAQELARNSHDPLVARGAVRGIAARGDPDATEFLADLLFDPEIPASSRMEAASGLAAANSPIARQALLRATYSDIDSEPSEQVLHEVLRGLAQEDDAQALTFVNGLLDHPEIDAESKIAAIEALAGARDIEVIRTLLKHAASQDAEIREAAVWSIAGHAEVRHAHQELVNLLESETAPWVRSNLYDALRVQEQMDVTPFWNRIISETDLSTRLAGMNLIAEHLPQEVAAKFDSEVVPELQQIVMEDPSLSNRVNAIIALGRAENSLEAEKLLHLLAQDSIDPDLKRAAELALQR